jgi:hypothetical protein
MVNRKNQNSILVLATLGVYLGLVLVGATPQALAQAAMTREFNIKDEVEVKDDLDRKPNPTPEEAEKAIDVYFTDLTSFVVKLQKLHAIKKFDPSHQIIRDQHSSFNSCSKNQSRFTIYEPLLYHNIGHWMILALSELKVATKNLNYLSDCLPYEANEESDNFSVARKSSLSLILEESNLRYEVSLNLSSIDRTKFLFSGLDKALTAFDVNDEENNAITLVLFKNTKLTTTNNQIVITTRLPRGSLDALLASRAK